MQKEKKNSATEMLLLPPFLAGLSPKKFILATEGGRARYRAFSSSSALSTCPDSFAVLIELSRRYIVSISGRRDDALLRHASVATSSSSFSSSLSLHSLIFSASVPSRRRRRLRHSHGCAAAAETQPWLYS